MLACLAIAAAAAAAACMQPGQLPQPTAAVLEPVVAPAFEERAAAEADEAAADAVAGNADTAVASLSAAGIADGKVVSHGAAAAAAAV